MARMNLDTVSSPFLNRNFPSIYSGRFFFPGLYSLYLYPSEFPSEIRR